MSEKSKFGNCRSDGVWMELHITTIYGPWYTGGGILPLGVLSFYLQILSECTPDYRTFRHIFISAAPALIAGMTLWAFKHPTYRRGKPRKRVIPNDSARGDRGGVAKFLGMTKFCQLIKTNFVKLHQGTGDNQM